VSATRYSSSLISVGTPTLMATSVRDLTGQRLRCARLRGHLEADPTALELSEHLVWVDAALGRQRAASPDAVPGEQTHRGGGGGGGADDATTQLPTLVRRGDAARENGALRAGDLDEVDGHGLRRRGRSGARQLGNSLLARPHQFLQALQQLRRERQC